ncbi:MAG: thiamine ABC transporter substrate-binding protein [Oligoflexia bacterium]|nr:thiamine ABC transporter substrate-binding protein [Oligoflexia bacterium]
MNFSGRSGFLGSVLFFFSAIAAAQAPTPPELVIYTYDSIVARGGLGPEIFPRFEKRCGCRVRALSSGDGGQLLTRLQLDAERGKPTAHLALGLDEALFERARPWLAEWGKWKPAGWDRLLRELKPREGFLPFDYGYFAFMGDREGLSGGQFPKSLKELLDPKWRRKLILQDPRTSTPGLAFVLYARAAGGEGFLSKFRGQWLTLAPGWDQAYGLFLRKEAPLVWSYTTSQAYHEEHGDPAGRYRALLFEEGQPIQIEGVALVKGTPTSPRQEALRREFLEFLISPEVQELVPRKNWMLPARVGTRLPASFEKLPRPRKIVRLPVEAHEIERVLEEWRHGVESAS